MPWPKQIPPDFKAVIETHLEFRTPEPQDVWADLVKLFERHGIAAPDSLLMQRPEGPDFFNQ